MGKIWEFLTATTPSMDVVAVAEQALAIAGPRFATDVDSGVLYGTPTLEDYIYGTAYKVSRTEALKCAPVKRARDLIAGALGQLPLRMYDATNKVVDWSLFNQPEAGIAKSITWTNVVENMLLSEVAWLKVTHIGWHNRPVEVQRLDPETVPIQKQYVTSPLGTAEVWPEVNGLIRIDSPNDGILVAGASAIRAVSRLQRAALNYVDGTPPQDWFEPTDGYDPYDETELAELLDDWQEKRRHRATAYVPANLAYKVNNLKALDMQLNEAREFATKEIARLTGIDAEELSVSTTSRTYANMQDRRRHFIENVLGPYMTAIEGRLSMDDVTPHGFEVRFDTSGYLRLDDLGAAQTDQILIAAGIATRNEVRAKRGLEALDGGDDLATPAAPAAPSPAAGSNQEPANA